jgi:hypothetical protein
MSEFQIIFFAEKVYVHYWPKDSPIWDEPLQKKLDKYINKNLNSKKIIVKSNIITIENFQFTHLKKIGVSIPFFKNECTMIFEGKFKDVFGHIHITTKSDNFLDIFNQLISWKNNFCD